MIRWRGPVVHPLLVKRNSQITVVEGLQSYLYSILSNLIAVFGSSKTCDWCTHLVLVLTIEFTSPSWQEIRETSVQPRLHWFVYQNFIIYQTHGLYSLGGVEKTKIE